MKQSHLLSLLWIVILPCISSALECALGYGENKVVRVISEAWINDGFCDCPLDGADEPNTEACSGAPVGGWAGVNANMESSPTFQCPQQKKLKLPLSRINDGICDCCDGADEPNNKNNSCKDICEKVLAEERAARKRSLDNYQIGSKKRKESLEQFNDLVKQTMVELEVADKEVIVSDQELQAVDEAIHAAKKQFFQSRREKVLATTESLKPLLLEPLTNAQLSLLIQLTCQIAGEMEGSMKKKTCVPLRLAGVDLGILWSKDKSNDASATLDDVEENVLIELVIDVARGMKKWSKEEGGKKEKRRRLDDYYGDDYYGDDDYAEAYRDEEYNDDYTGEEEAEEQEDVVQSNEADGGDESDDDDSQGKLAEVKKAVEEFRFSKSRHVFLDKSHQLAASIDKFVEEKKREEEEEKQKLEEKKIREEEEKKSEEAPSETEQDASPEVDEESEEAEDASDDDDIENFDPAPYNNVKDELREREEAIERGFHYAVSAIILTGAILDGTDESKIRIDLMNLAAGTLMHSKIGAVHLWQILDSILFPNDELDEAKTCSSPLAHICPVRTLNGAYPPQEIVKAGEEACAAAVDAANSYAGCNVGENGEIPLEAPDGFYGYNVVQARGDGDALQHHFEGAENFIPEELSRLESNRRLAETKKSSAEKKVTDLEDKIGGREQNDNLTAELHGIKDSCHIVTEGKYDYEVCIYGKAAQKDKGSKASGTSLGKWTGMSIDEESGDRVMKWENGQQCWNGPKRSATVIVKCGADTTVISAEEPDTCRYLLEMESYIACDEDYYQKYLAE